jgi:hypothetical protein
MDKAFQQSMNIALAAIYPRLALSLRLFYPTILHSRHSILPYFQISTEDCGIWAATVYIIM